MAAEAPADRRIAGPQPSITRPSCSARAGAAEPEGRAPIPYRDSNPLVAGLGPPPILATAMGTPDRSPAEQPPRPAEQPPRPADLRSRLADLMVRDEHRLTRRLNGTRRIRDRRARDLATTEIAAEIEAAARRVERRRAAVPAVSYPEELPITGRKDEILAAIRDHQVVIVAGETGSGKTTQLPKICLELGRGVRGMIGHTQPRRLAARTVAARIAEELGTPLGGAVGYQVRFTGQVGEDTLVKLMTDGILLAEIPSDRNLSPLRHADHRRGARAQPQHRLHPRVRQAAPAAPAGPEGHHHLGDHRDRTLLPPLRRRARRSRSPAARTPSRCATGRCWPSPAPPPTPPPARTTATRSRPSATPSTSCPPRRRGTCWSSSAASGRSATPPTRCAAATCPTPRSCRSTPGCPRPSSTGCSSRTGAGASCSRPTSPRPRSPCPASGTSSTPAPPGSPATATAPRCSGCRSSRSRRPRPTSARAAAGGVSDGICIRLYSEADFLGRPEFTEPEILRTNLASVILQMTALGLGDVAAFPFIDPPDRRNIADGIALLQELGALDPADEHPADPDRAQAGAAADRPAARAHGARGRPQRLPARGAGHRRRAVHTGPTRATAGQAAGRRRRCTPASPTRPPTSWPT